MMWTQKLFSTLTLQAMLHVLLRTKANSVVSIILEIKTQICTTLVTFEVLTTVFTRDGVSSWCQLDGRLGGLRSPSGRYGEQTNYLYLLGMEPKCVQPVAGRYAEWTTRNNFIFISVKMKTKVMSSLHPALQFNYTAVKSSLGLFAVPDLL
jgi:hypothetical protein